ncbi:LEA domain protein [Metarhizium rileyi]|uniref:LEA domain protein n=1 Tax=Metarhizium rileyi (strain RCEF 4871) TaxID=1649241 RepID=A0A166XL69_METRR|nr:LEA domain protein [Metarhizium rileyi RCEF 4871]
MAASGSTDPISPPPSLACQDSERMTGTSTPRTDVPETQPAPKPEGSSSSCPLRAPRSQQDAQNEPIEIPKIMTDISFTEDPVVLVRGLEGKCVDEFGNILDWDGTVLGRVEGDLPSMVGRSVSGDGRVRDAAGDLAGHVSENHIISSAPTESHSSKRLKIDHTGTIYDHHGALVGKMKDHSKESNRTTTESCTRCRERAQRTDTGPQRQSSEEPTESAHVPRRTATPSPSDIYLDVKSTHDGIQLIIKIPTVFNRNYDSRK